MNYRVEDILAWFIPGFYTLMAIGIIFGVLHADEINCMLSCNPEKCSCVSPALRIAGLLKDSLPLLLFVLPVTAMVIGWMLNALGGLLYSCCLFNWPIARTFNLAIKEDSYEEGGVTYTKGVPSDKEKVKLYRGSARFSIELKKVDRFYYRYVLSRNMTASQLSIILLLVILGFAFHFPSGMCALLWLSVGLLGIYYGITARDLTTHSRHVWEKFLKKRRVEATASDEQTNNEQGVQEGI